MRIYKICYTEHIPGKGYFPYGQSYSLSEYEGNSYSESITNEFIFETKINSWDKGWVDFTQESVDEVFGDNNTVFVKNALFSGLKLEKNK